MVNESNWQSELNEEKKLRTIIEADLSLRLRQQEAIARLGEYALGCQDLDSLLQEVVVCVSETLDMEFVKVLQYLPDSDVLLLRAGVGWSEGLVGRATVGTELDSQAGYTLLSQEPIIVEDARTETRFSESALLRDHNVISGMSVVIPGKGIPFGVLGTHSNRRHNFHPHDTRFIKAIASILATAIQRFAVENELQCSRDELAIILQGITEGVTVQDRIGHLVYVNQAAAGMMGFETITEALETPLTEVRQRFSLFDEDGNPYPYENLPGRLVMQGYPKASAKVKFRITATGEEHWAIIDASPIMADNGKAEQVINIFRDITDLMETEQTQRFLAEAGNILSSSLDYESTLKHVAELSVTNLADWCSVHVVKESNEIIQLAVLHKDPAMMDMALQIEQRYPPNPANDGTLAQVIKTGQPAFFPHITDELLQKAARDEEHLKIIRTLGMRSAVVVPLVARGRTLGAITFIWSDSGRQASKKEVELCQELARRAALAIDNARLFQEVQQANNELEHRIARRTQQLVQTNRKLEEEIAEKQRTQAELTEMHRRLFESIESERLRISRDLHDGPIQDLYGVSLFMETFREYLQEEDQVAEFQEILGNITTIIASLREICGELRPPILEQFGLERAIRAHLNRLRDKYPDVKFDTHLVGDGLTLSERTRLTLYRVYQTAISNVLRHAQASQVWVDFRLEDGKIRLEIKDNGKGFNVPVKWIDLARDGHFGLVGMAERVESLGGQLHIDSALEQGTRVHLEVPLEESLLSNMAK